MNGYNGARSQPPCNVYIVASGTGRLQPVPRLGVAPPAAMPAVSAARVGASLGYDPLPPTPVCTHLPNGTRRCCITSPYDGSVHCAVLPGDNGGGSGSGNDQPRSMVGAVRAPRPSNECVPLPGGYQRCCTTVPPSDEGGGGSDPEGGGGGDYGQRFTAPTQGFGAVHAQPSQHNGGGFDCTLTGSYADGDLALKCRPR